MSPLGKSCPRFWKENTTSSDVLGFCEVVSEPVDRGNPIDLNIFEYFFFSFYVFDMLPCQRPFKKKETNKPPQVVMELEEWFFCGLESWLENWKQRVGFSGCFSGWEVDRLVPCRSVLRQGPEKGACGEVSGLADTKLFWVVECQARKLSESAVSTGTSRRGSLHLENVRLCV